METNDIVDIVIAGVAVVFCLFFIVVISVVAKNKEYEFNKLWRTRLFLCVLAILFTLLLAVSNIRWIVQQIKELKFRRISCSLFSYVRQCFALPLFLAVVSSLAFTLVNSDVLESRHPNGLIVKRGLLWTLSMILVGLVNVFLSVFKADMIFFQTYDEDEGFCIESPFYSVISVIFPLGLMIAILRYTVCAKPGPVLHEGHAVRMRRLPFLMIPFIIAAGTGVPQEFLSGVPQLALKYVEAVLYLMFVVVYLNYVVLRPAVEAKASKLLRGTITRRHGNFIEQREGLVEHELENISSDHNRSREDESGLAEKVEEEDV